MASSWFLSSKILAVANAKDQFIKESSKEVGQEKSKSEEKNKKKQKRRNLLMEPAILVVA